MIFFFLVFVVMKILRESYSVLCLVFDHKLKTQSSTYNFSSASISFFKSDDGWIVIVYPLPVTLYSPMTGILLC